MGEYIHGYAIKVKRNVSHYFLETKNIQKTHNKNADMTQDKQSSETQNCPSIPNSFCLGVFIFISVILCFTVVILSVLAVIGGPSSGFPSGI